MICNGEGKLTKLTIKYFNPKFCENNNLKNVLI